MTPAAGTARERSPCCSHTGSGGAATCPCRRRSPSSAARQPSWSRSSHGVAGPGHGFEVYSTLLGCLAPLGRRGDRGLVLRPPLHGLAGLAPEPGLVASPACSSAPTAFDGLTRTPAWTSAVDPDPLVVGTLELAGSIALVDALYVVGMRTSAVVVRRRPPQCARRVRRVPRAVALAHTVAHYFSLLVLEGQVTWILASDSSRTGLDLLGTAGDRIDYTRVAPRRSHSCRSRRSSRDTSPGRSWRTTAPWARSPPDGAANCPCSP